MTGRDNTLPPLVNPRLSMSQAALLFLAGCRGATPTATSPHAAPLEEDALAIVSEELAFLSDTVSATTFILAMMAGVLALLVLAVASRFVRRIRRRYRLLAPEISVGFLLTGVIFIAFIFVILFHYLSIRIPLVATVGIAAAIAGFAFFLVQHLPAWSIGFSLVLRRSVREGDIIRLGEIEGVVEHIGFLRLVLLDTNGARVYLGLANLGRTSVTVSSPSKEHLVEHVYHHPEVLTEGLLKQIQTIAVLSPYRIAASRVRLDLSRDNSLEVRIRFQTWSEDAKERAVAHLKRSLETQIQS